MSACISRAYITCIITHLIEVFIVKKNKEKINLNLNLNILTLPMFIQCEEVYLDKFLT